MKIAVIGATGRLGGAVARAAAERGHDVTPLHRPTVDAADPASVAVAVAGQDAVVASLKGPDRLVPRAASALLDGLARAGVDRLVFVGGGGSLEYAPGRRVVDSPDFPQQYRQLALDQGEALDILRAAATTVRWSYLSPPPVHLFDGPPTGAYRALAQDRPITDPGGQSRLSTGDLAAAVLAAIEQDTFVGQRFTAAY
jgi:putative NADH-flavin reductase